MGSAVVKTDERFEGIDLLRFTAAAGVVFYHFCFLSWALHAQTVSWPVQGMPAFPEVKEWASVGWVGVQVFFVISGFVISFSSENATPFQFFRRRVLRLIPALWLAAPITVVALLFHGSNAASLEEPFLKSLFLWPKGPWIEGTYWTLCLEVVFYAIIFLVLLSRRHRHLMWVVAAMGMVSSVLCLVAVMPNPVSAALAVHLLQWPCRLMLLRNGSEFALGAMMLAASRQRPDFKRGLVLALLVAGSLADIWLQTRTAAAAHLGLVGTYGPMVIWALCIGLMAVSVNRTMSALISRKLPPSVSKQLGAATYPLYLVHQTLGWIVLAAIYRETGSRGLALAGALAVVAWATIVILSIEPQFRLGMDQLLFKHRFFSFITGQRVGLTGPGARPRT